MKNNPHFSKAVLYDYFAALFLDDKNDAKKQRVIFNVFVDHSDTFRQLEPWCIMFDIEGGDHFHLMTFGNSPLYTYITCMMLTEFHDYLIQEKNFMNNVYSLYYTT